jgi:hypothetical protein
MAVSCLVIGTAGSVSAANVTVTATVGGCQLANGAQHVVEITFDNVHFFRDNPNVPSDLELMPHLLSFIQNNGVMMSNNHTPLIAHTAEDSLAIYTGLYGDRHGMPISNSYRTYNPSGTTDPAGSFVYWTDPINDTASSPTAGHDTKQSMIYSPTVPAAATSTNVTAPAPWVPFTRAGCTVGNVSTANMVLENVSPDIGNVFGAGSPEANQLAADSTTFKDQENADYTGIAVHCAQSDAICANAQTVKYGQSTPSNTAVTDSLPDEPGGYTGFQGHRYVAPQIGAGSANLSHNGFPVTNAAGNLVDLSGQEIQNSFTHTPGFPGFGPIVATQTLAYMADMQEANIPVTYGYIGDLHERKNGQSGCGTATATGTGFALGPGDTCFLQTAAAYDQAFNTFFQRLAAAGLNSSNTLFVFSSEENDHFAGANVGRAIQPSPAGCNGNPTPCTYASGQVGELNTNLNGLLAAQKSNSTPFVVEPQGAVLYVNGQPTPADPANRQLERDTGSLTAPANPYSGVSNEPIAAYLAGATEQQILHLVNADPLRTPSFALFPKPDYFFGLATSCTAANQAPCISNTGSSAHFAWNHGYYTPNINNTWVGFVGPGVANGGLDGPAANNGPAVHHPNGDGTVPNESTVGTWLDLTDIRPTLLRLGGLHDTYTPDGRVLSEIMTNPNTAIADPNYVPLAQCYKQLNASVGRFGTSTLIADTAALKSGSSVNDSQFTSVEGQLATLLSQRDTLATTMKNELTAAAFSNTPLPGSAASDTQSCNELLTAADTLGGVTPPAQTPEAPLAVLLPGAALALGGAALVVGRRRRVRSAPAS